VEAAGPAVARPFRHNWGGRPKFEFLVRKPFRRALGGACASQRRHEGTTGALVMRNDTGFVPSGRREGVWRCVVAQRHGTSQRPSQHYRAHEHTHQHDTRCTHTSRLCPVHLPPQARVSNLAPAAGKRASRSPATWRTTARLRAPAGRAPLANQVNAMYGVYRRHPPNQCAAPRPRVPTGCATPRSSP